MIKCGNALAVKVLAAEGHDPNHADYMGRQPLTTCFRGAEMIDALLEAGAKVDLLTGTISQSDAALRRLLELFPEQMKAKFGAEQLIWQGGFEVLERVKMVREFGFQAPSFENWSFGNWKLEKDSLRHRVIAGALFTFQYTHERPDLSVPIEYERFLWRPWTHYAYDISIRLCVWTALLCLKRARCDLPSELRQLILIAAFGDELF